MKFSQKKTNCFGKKPIKIIFRHKVTYYPGPVLLLPVLPVLPQQVPVLPVPVLPVPQVPKVLPVLPVLPVSVTNEYKCYRKYLENTPLCERGEYPCQCECGTVLWRKCGAKIHRVKCLWYLHNFQCRK